MASNSDNISIAIMGGTGTGKTTFTNLTGGSKFIVGNGLESCTKEIQTHTFTFDRHNVTLVDIPGFDDTSKSDADILKMIADFLVTEYNAGRRLSGVMYFHRISDVRMGGTSKRNFVMFQKLCGDDAFTNVAIVTTRWDKEDEAVGSARLEELKTKPQLYKPILGGGGAIFRHERTQESANTILAHLITKTAKPLLIQHEMVKEGKELSETSAGKELQQEILKQVERHQKEMEEVLEELKLSRDTSELEGLEAECNALQEQAMHWQDEARKLAEAPNPIVSNQALKDPDSSTSPVPTPTQPLVHSIVAHDIQTDGLYEVINQTLVGAPQYRSDKLKRNRERKKVKLEGAVKYLLDIIGTVLYTADSLRRGVVLAATGSRDRRPC